MNPNTRANAALAIAARQYANARQQDQTSSDEDIIDNLDAVPSVIKDFLKTRVSHQNSPVASLQNQSQEQNPLLQQQQVYQQITERLTRRFRPQMSQGRAVGGVQLPPDKAINYLRSEPDFNALPSEYQKYVLGVIGGQDAITLHGNMDAVQTQNFKDRHALALKSAENDLQFGNSPTKMVQKNLEEGKWYPDVATNRLMKREKNPVTGMSETNPLEPWEAMHVVNEAPKLGFGDMTRFLNSQQQAGLKALSQNPNANVADIVQAVSKGRQLQASPDQLSQIAGMPGQIPEATRGQIPGQLANLQTLSPERIATMRQLGYKFDGSSFPSSVSPGEDDFTKLPPSPGFVASNNSYKGMSGRAPLALPAGQQMGRNVSNWLQQPAQIPEIAPFIGAQVQNLGSAVSGANDWVRNFALGLGAPSKFLPTTVRIPQTSTEQMRGNMNNMFQGANDALVNAVPDWLLPH